MKDLPNISIVVPAFNSEKYIQQSLETIFQSKFLSIASFEVIVVNDGSYDQTENILNALNKKYQTLRVFHLKKNLGQLTATNMGIELAQARYIVTIDDDLQFNPDDIEKLYNKINSSAYWIVNGKSNVLSSSKKYLFFRKIGVELVFALFFKQYIEKGFFSSFKIIDKEALKRNNIINIYHFWEIPTNKIGYCKLNKSKGIRGKTAYSFFLRFKVFVHILAKIFSYFLLFIGFVFFISGMILKTHIFVYISLFSFIIFLFNNLFLYFHRRKHLSKKHA